MALRNGLSHSTGSWNLTETTFDEATRTAETHIFNVMNTASFFKYITPVGVNMVLPKRYHTNVHFPNYNRTWNGPFDPKALMLPGFGPFLFQMGFSGGEITQEIIIVHEY